MSADRSFAASRTDHGDAAATLARWIEAEAAVRARHGGQVGVMDAASVRGMDGLAMMRALLSGEGPAPSITRTLDFLLVDVDRGRAEFQGTPGPAHLNPMGGVHGGWIATLLDSALGCAVHTMMPVGRGYTTVELGINIVRGLTPAVPRVRAIGTVVHCGRQLATAEGRLVGPDGTLYAHGTTTCLVFELPAARTA